MSRNKVLAMATICLAVSFGSVQAAPLLVDACINQATSTWLLAATGGANYDNDEWEADPSLGLTITGKGNQYNATFWGGSPVPVYSLWQNVFSAQGTLLPDDAYNALADYRYYSAGDPATAGNITIANLKPGTYELTVYGFKADTSTSTYTFYANEVQIGTTQNVPYNNPSNLTAAEIVDRISTTVSITILDSGPYANMLVVRSGDWDQPLNGIMLTPEPGTLVLLALGGLAVLRRQRA